MVGVRAPDPSHQALPIDSPSATSEPKPELPDPATALPDPQPDPPTYPSGITIQLANRDVELPADDSCWRTDDDCRRGLLLNGPSVPDVGSPEVIDFRFERPGWQFTAIFRSADQDCPRATTVQATPTGDVEFQVTPADQAGRYEVDLSGQGPEGFVSARFVWTTSADGPVEPAQGLVGLFPNSGALGTFALEVDINDLPFQPTESELSALADVTITGADGTEHDVSAPLIEPSLPCRDRASRGAFYCQGEWDQEFSTLGGSPFYLEVGLSIRGTRYAGRATWRKIKGEASMAPITLTPPLPTIAGD